MTNALWCDPGGHPFPAGQPGSTTIKVSEQVKNEWGGYQPHDVVQDVCAACANDLGYRGMNAMKKSDAELAVQAADERKRTGGKLGAARTIADSERELEGVRLSEVERRLNEIQYPDSKR